MTKNEDPRDARERRERYRGALLGLAAGDALGTTVEFKPPGTFEPVTDMVGGGPFRLRPGEWTDDTAMTLCLAESLVEGGGFDLVDQMERYVRWYREGHLSSNGRCFDIGATVAGALHRFETHGDPFAGNPDPGFGGNGSLMRLAPVALAYAREPGEAVRLAGVMSRTTHPAREPVDACRYYAGLMVGALDGVPRPQLLAPRFSPLAEMWETHPLAPRIDTVAAGSFKTRQPPDIRGTGYVVDALEAALWAFHHSDDFRTGALMAVNLGHDADTTGAIYGQLAGAYYGLEGVPLAWRTRLARRDQIIELADALFDFAESWADQTEYRAEGL